MLSPINGSFVAFNVTQVNSVDSLALLPDDAKVDLTSQIMSQLNPEFCEENKSIIKHLKDV